MVTQLPTTINYGQRKTILLGSSVSINNNQNVEISSTFYGGLANKFFNVVSNNSIIKLNKGGQSIELIAMKSYTDVDYWHIISGNYDL